MIRLWRFILPVSLFFTSFLSAKDSVHNYPFSIREITRDSSFDPRWNIPPSSLDQEEISKALSQPYHYATAAGQCFVFFSQDGHYVLKLLKERLYRPSGWIGQLPYPLNRYKQSKRDKKRERDFTSYKLAFENLKEETGLLWVHLNPSGIDQKITIVDQNSVTHTLELDRFDFILQRRAELVYPTITSLMEKQDIEAAKAAIDQVIKLMRIFREKGILDRDPVISSNFGFVGEKAISLDIGSYVRKNDPLKFEKNWNKNLLAFRKWLEAHYPELVEQLEFSCSK